MKDSKAILEIARQTIALEGDAIHHLATLLTEDFSRAVSCILEADGRVVITGIGKSAIIASKIVATLNSTGTPAIYMHAADAIHGDLGTIQQNDVVICISKSGNTPEIKLLVPLIKQGGNPLIGMTGSPDSFLGRRADYCLNTYVEKEACPNNLAPTTSTTAQLVLGDALAICLLELRGFSSRDFARYHPGGTLGKKLYLRVGDIAAQNQVPQVSGDTPVKDAIVEISEKMLGVTAVMDGDRVAGIITDGDIRRMLNKHDNIAGLRARDIMTTGPKTVDSEVLAVKALQMMEENDISQLLATRDGRYIGVVHIHNLIKEGIL
ncbi:MULTISPECIES: KpsF/GutQ family sugar-phosphate isomerase [Robiginitalea]|uniref:Capsule expression protein KpsF/GutQ n=1 Tax=Robiginitalea biformata (strain ATCC BAA-864 / DSM 15991 / KCTC 12146 / HTCC2501) TaxID=313596 RepID=A4CMV1_ROBBH|nr:MULTISPECIES: KpsF/GutQ family sugar-phosphate isomerase [Robiginitalea]EAR14993.1 capsule expression protein KpsF/GutQ [Robiginitalea biformata HTCC2501]MDC6355190.1 KpsF/GutQ family sugar-phosphate isomerase [Robiginitalea sp. PM2]MDC6375595.1 KpsF/GutQ family sugar-phosphate isomerase [Robiginitalea sp. SP8]